MQLFWALYETRYDKTGASDVFPQALVYITDLDSLDWPAGNNRFESRLLKIPSLTQTQVDDRYGIAGFEEASLEINNIDNAVSESSATGQLLLDAPIIIRVFKSSGDSYEEFAGRISSYSARREQYVITAKGIGMPSLFTELPKITTSDVIEQEKLSSVSLALLYNSVSNRLTWREISGGLTSVFPDIATSSQVSCYVVALGKVWTARGHDIKVWNLDGTRASTDDRALSEIEHASDTIEAIWWDETDFYVLIKGIPGGSDTTYILRYNEEWLFRQKLLLVEATKQQTVTTEYLLASSDDTGNAKIIWRAIDGATSSTKSDISIQSDVPAPEGICVERQKIFVIKQNIGSKDGVVVWGIDGARDSVSDRVLQDMDSSRDRATGLCSDGQFYYVSVRMPDATPPRAPRQLTSGGGDGFINIGWTAPTADKRAPVTGYKIRYKLSTAAVWSDWPHPGVATTATIAGLSNNLSYNAQVQAQSIAGPSSWSLTLTASPYLAPPSQPRNLRLSHPAVTTLRLKFTRPEFPGASAWHYVIEYRPGTSGPWTVLRGSYISSQTHLRVEITGLTKGTRYQVRIYASNSGGDSPHAVASALAALPPNKVAGITHNNLSTSSSSLAWPEPNGNGAAVSAYEYRYKKVSETQWSQIVVTQARSTTLTGLSPGVPYHTQVRARNAVGISAWSDIHRWTTATSITIQVPDQVDYSTIGTTLGTQIESGYRRRTLAWTAPANNGSAITGYEIRLKDRGVASWDAEESSSASFVIPADKSSLNLNITIRAKNPQGWGEYSKVTSVAAVASLSPVSTSTDMAPIKPAGLSVVMEETRFLLNWDQSTDESIVDWEYQRKAETDANWPSAWNAISKDTYATRQVAVDHSFAEGEEQNFRIRAMDADGDSTVSDSVSGVYTERTTFYSHATTVPSSSVGTVGSIFVLGRDGQVYRKTSSGWQRTKLSIYYSPRGRFSLSFGTFTLASDTLRQTDGASDTVISASTGKVAFDSVSGDIYFTTYRNRTWIWVSQGNLLTIVDSAFHWDESKSLYGTIIDIRPWPYTSTPTAFLFQRIMGVNYSVTPEGVWWEKSGNRVINRGKPDERGARGVRSAAPDSLAATGADSIRNVYVLVYDASWTFAKRIEVPASIGDAQGISTDGSFLFLVDGLTKHLRAVTKSDGTREPSRDIDLTALTEPTGATYIDGYHVVADHRGRNVRFFRTNNTEDVAKAVNYPLPTEPRGIADYSETITSDLPRNNWIGASPKDLTGDNGNLYILSGQYLRALRKSNGERRLSLDIDLATANSAIVSPSGAGFFQNGFYLTVPGTRRIYYIRTDGTEDASRGASIASGFSGAEGFSGIKSQITRAVTGIVEDNAGSFLPIIFGRAVKIPLIEVRKDDVNREYHYLLGMGMGLNSKYFKEVYTVYKEKAVMDSITGSIGSVHANGNVRLSSGDRRPDSWYNDWWIEITAGAGVGQIQRITAYSSYTNTISIEGAWGVLPTTSSTYRLREWRFYDGSQTENYTHHNIAYIRFKKYVGDGKKLYADVYGLVDEVNPARAVESILSNKQWGLGLTVLASDFVTASALVTDLKCEGALLDQEQALDFIRDILKFRDMLLHQKIASGASVVGIEADRPIATVDATLALGSGEHADNIADRSPGIDSTKTEEITKNLNVKYRRDNSESLYMHAVRRKSFPVGADQEEEFPYVYDHSTADRVAHYRAKRLALTVQRMSLRTAIESLNRRNVVWLDVPFLVGAKEKWQVVKATKNILESSLELVRYSDEPYSYVPITAIGGILPTDETFAVLPNYEATPPDPVSNFKTAIEGWKTGRDILVEAMLTWTAPAENYGGAVIAMKESSQDAASYHEVATTGESSVTITGLSTAKSYDFKIEAWNINKSLRSYPLFSLNNTLSYSKIWIVARTYRLGHDTGMQAFILDMDSFHLVAGSYRYAYQTTETAFIGTNASIAAKDNSVYAVENKRDRFYSINGNMGSPAEGRWDRLGTQTRFGASIANPDQLRLSEGTLYMLGRVLNALFSVDSSTGRATRIGSATDFGVGETDPGAIFPYKENLYMTGNSTRKLYLLNKETGTASTPWGHVVNYGLTGVTAPRIDTAMLGTALVYLIESETKALYHIDPHLGGIQHVFEGTLTRVGTQINFGLTPTITSYQLFTWQNSLYMFASTGAGNALRTAVYQLDGHTGEAHLRGTDPISVYDSSGGDLSAQYQAVQPLDLAKEVFSGVQVVSRTSRSIASPPTFRATPRDLRGLSLVAEVAWEWDDQSDDALKYHEIQVYETASSTDILASDIIPAIPGVKSKYGLGARAGVSRYARVRGVDIFGRMSLWTGRVKSTSGYVMSRDRQRSVFTDTWPLLNWGVASDIVLPHRYDSTPHTFTFAHNYGHKLIIEDWHISMTPINLPAGLSAVPGIPIVSAVMTQHDNKITWEVMLDFVVGSPWTHSDLLDFSFTVEVKYF